MAFSTQRAVSDGTLVQLAVSIEYFDRTELTVFFDGILSPEVDGLWSWVGTTDTKINFTPAVPNGVEVMIARNTALTEPRHQYTKGAQFIAETLDENFTQALRIVQEAKEGSGLSDIFNDLDLHGFKIRNVADATLPSDVITYGQYTADAAGAGTARADAIAAASAALASQNASAGSASTATTQAGVATAQAIISTNQASTATTKAGEAYASAAAALSSANNADTSFNAALTQANNALNSATQAAASYDSFDDRYLGPKASAPTLDNDGNALLTGALYWDTTSTTMFVRTSGGTWQSTAAATAAGVSNTPAGTISATTVQAALNELATEKVATTLRTSPGTNLNTLTTSGFYRLDSNQVNGPLSGTGSDNSLLLVCRGMDTIAQIYVGYGTGIMYTRAGSPTDVGGTGVWLPWSRTLMSTSGISTIPGSIEVGDAGVANTPFIDFHSGAINTDYDSRIIATGGNGAAGGGEMVLNASRLFNTGWLSLGGASASTNSAIRTKYPGSGNEWDLGPDSGSAFVVYKGGTGVWLGGGGTAWIANSDYRIKDIIEPIVHAKEKVQSLRTVIYKLKADESARRRVGFIAQDVQAVLPEAVSIAEDEIGTLGVAYSDVVPLITAAVKEAFAEIDELRARLEALEQR